MSFIRRYGCLKRKSKYRYVVFIYLFIYLLSITIHLFVMIFRETSNCDTRFNLRNGFDFIITLITFCF